MPKGIGLLGDAFLILRIAPHQFVELMIRQELAIVRGRRRVQVGIG